MPVAYWLQPRTSELFAPPVGGMAKSERDSEKLVTFINKKIK